MFGCLDGLIGAAKSKKRDKESFDDLHHCLVINAERQSKRDFPRMSIRNGIIDGTKNVCFRESWEQLCVTLCDAHTFREGIDGKQHETKENPIENVYRMSETISGI